MINPSDAERARAPEQGIADLRRMIEDIEMECGAYLFPAVTHSVGRPTYLLDLPRHDPPAMPG